MSLLKNVKKLNLNIVKLDRKQQKKGKQNLGLPKLNDSFLRPFGKDKKKTNGKENKISKNESGVNEVRSLIQDMTSDLGNDLNKLNQKFSKISTVLNALVDRVEKLEERDAEHCRMHTENGKRISKLQKSCNVLERNYEELDRKSRLNKVVLTCDQIKVDSSSLHKDTIKFLTDKMNLDSQLKTHIHVSKFGKGKHTVMLELPSTIVKKHLFRAKKEIMDSDNAPKMLFLNEFLTKRKAELLKKAREMKKDKLLHSAYVFEGNVFVRESGDSDNVIIHTIQDLEDFEE